MYTGMKVRRPTGGVAVMATAFGVLATPAAAATGPTATSARDRNGRRDHRPRPIRITLDANRIAIDFGANGTTDDLVEGGGAGVGWEIISLGTATTGS